ncbi:MAG: hypothetical protein JWO63_988, partial [Frankiales bacterium]|nr:hypothetical protein [Frankiales bacterium]
TLLLLLPITVMPFAASLLGSYGGTAFALATYGAVNVVAVLALMWLSADLNRLKLLDPQVPNDADYRHRWESWMVLGVYLLCLPAGYVLGRHGPYVLLLLAVPTRLTMGRGLIQRWRRRS